MDELRIIDLDDRHMEPCREAPDNAGLIRLMATLVEQVPAGSVTTPGTLAEALGDRGTARFVGGLLSKLRADADEGRAGDIPLHRVVLSTGDAPWRSSILKDEGVPVVDRRVQDLEGSMFHDFSLDDAAPFHVLGKLQEEGAKKVVLTSGPDWGPSRVAGVDVSYGGAGDGAVACCTVMDPEGGHVLEQVAVRMKAVFPYVPGYLGFREVPPMAAAVQALEEQPDIVLVDGHGILHPRRFGVACHLGITLDMPAVGCAKNLLVGEVVEGVGDVSDRTETGTPVPVMLDGEALGWRVTPPRGSRPAWISPGHRMGVEGSLALVQGLLRHQSPEPVRLSHTASKAVASGVRPG